MPPQSYKACLFKQHPEHASLFFHACLPNGYHEYHALVPDPYAPSGSVWEILYEQHATKGQPPRL